jgi:sugar transferase (PEP-CTERM/EpsH1 system associated)
LHYYRHAGLKAWIDDVMLRYQPRQAFVFSSAMADFVMAAPYGSVRRVVDFVDVDSDKWRQYAATKRWPTNWVYRRESAKLLTYDRSVAAAFDASVFVSAHEADLFREIAPESAHKVFDVANGVDFAYFSPDWPYQDPYGGDDRVLAFTGAMDYWPNVDAVRWFAIDLLPRVRERVPAARFAIVGANPTAEVRRLARLPGVTVTGRVPDVRPYLAHAAAVVAPLRISRGVQNKVLEAMAMAKAVIASQQALEGIAVEPGRDVLLADDGQSFALETIAALTAAHPEAIGRRARARVVDGYGWATNLARLDEILQGPPSGRRYAKAGNEIASLVGPQPEGRTR